MFWLKLIIVIVIIVIFKWIKWIEWFSWFLLISLINLLHFLTYFCSNILDNLNNDDTNDSRNDDLKSWIHENRYWVKFYRLLVNDFLDWRLACISRIANDRLIIVDLLIIDNRAIVRISNRWVTWNTRNFNVSLISFSHESIVFVSKSTFYAWDNDLRCRCFAFWNDRRIIKRQIVVKCSDFLFRLKVLIDKCLFVLFDFFKES